MTSLPSPRLRICMRSALTWLALACAAVGSTQHSHVPPGILSTLLARRLTGLILVEIAQVVAVDATVLARFGLELAWIAWSALRMAEFIFCFGICARGAWNAASAIYDPI